MVKLTKLSRPFVVAVAASFRDGADAVELNLAALPAADQPSAAFFRKSRGPIYTSCRRAAFMRIYGACFARLPVWNDEERMDWQLEALGRGSAGLDIEADTFAPSPDEWTRDREAIRRQRFLAAAARRHGAAVIFSWHPPHALTFAEARRAAGALEARGADFIKIVERVRNEREALAAVAISLRLRKKLATPFIFLPLGPGAERFRPFMTAFGAAYLLARPPVGANRLPAQPPVAQARALLDLA